MPPTAVAIATKEVVKDVVASPAARTISMYSVRSLLSILSLLSLSGDNSPTQRQRWPDLERDEDDPVGVQYKLIARKDGYYPELEWGKGMVGFTYLRAGDTWKIGETMLWNSATRQQFRYPKWQLIHDGVYFIPEYEGTQPQIRTQEYIKLGLYQQIHGKLPPGNKMDR